MSSPALLKLPRAWSSSAARSLIWGLVLAIPGLCTGAYADDSDSAWQVAKPSGSISNQFQVYRQRFFGLPDVQERLDATVESGLSNGTYGLKLAPWGWLRAPEAVGGNAQQVSINGDLKEAWAERVSPTIDIRAGNQILAWGTADQINPTDVWNPHDTYDLFQSPKLAVTALDVRIHPAALDQFSLELVGTPFFRSTPLPISYPDSGTRAFSLSDSRWFLPFPTSVAASGGFSAPLQYQITSATYPSTWQGGARLKVTSVHGWDFSASYANLVESTPRFAFTAAGDQSNPTLPVVITLNPSFHRQQMFGLDGAGSVTFGDTEIGLRFEGAYFARDNSRAYQAPAAFQHDLLRDDYFHLVAGADYTFKRKILGTVLYLNLQYVHYQRIGNLEQTPGALVISGLPNVIPWDRNFVLYWEDRIGQDSQFKFQGTLVASAQNGDGMWSPTIVYAWNDNLKTQVGAEVLFGNPKGFFGQFADNSRFSLGVTYAF